jgi:hypothetical protein
VDPNTIAYVDIRDITPLLTPSRPRELYMI